jgi:hypothetical protein
MRNYQHYTSKGTACNNKGHVVRNDKDVIEHKILSSIR